jgi:hypothetical protein
MTATSNASDMTSEYPLPNLVDIHRLSERERNRAGALDVRQGGAVIELEPGHQRSHASGFLDRPSAIVADVKRIDAGKRVRGARTIVDRCQSASRRR